ncbi:hypothetical protein [Shewanella sedimentimangrovi]|uniref:Uncharacterized protein n=1 Tax=Shewanella sedimentimangrovi TaxID=2814293 RepID=A0ABX7R2Q3_9GAMM|nr:hypothetical protein [Shewanella sedimentimangrovi]QSX37567.1 hypothetical protein JYB85_01600 [Shewanella sedimentimangrovi]
MTVLPRKDKEARIKDIANMILPELVPDQLQLLGIADSDIDITGFAEARNHSTPGMALLQLTKHRADAIIAKGSKLYAPKSQDRESQLDYVNENSNILMRQWARLTHLLTHTSPNNQAILRLIDLIIESSVLAGYYAGSNDMLALTDRYVDSGYNASVAKPQKGGQAKAKVTEPVKILVQDMANFVYQEPNLASTTKATLAEAIVQVLQDFSATGNNKSIPALKKFPNRAPELDTVNKWIKSVVKPSNTSSKPKASLAVVTAKLKAAYTTRQIAASLA